MIHIINLSPIKGAKQPTYSFVLNLGDAIIIPGFRVFAGVIHAPARKKNKGGWIQTLHLSPNLARNLYDQLQSEYPQVPLASPEATLKYLAYDDFTFERYHQKSDDALGY